MIQILNITDKAKERLKQLISNNSDCLGVIIKVVGGGCSGYKYSFDYLTQINDNDKVIDLGDFKIVVDNSSCTYIEGSVLDYVTDNFSEKFEFSNPNATSKCGCGKSFGI